MSRTIRRLALWIMAAIFLLSASIPGGAAYIASEGRDKIKSTVTSKKDYALMSGVTESSVALSDGHQGFMLQVAPSAKAKLKVSYSKYFAEGSSKATRTAAVSGMSYSFTRPTVQAAAYEKATSRNVIFAMNGNFAFDSGEPMGLIKVEGNVIHPSDSNAKIYFAILKDGSYAFRTYTDDHSDVLEAVAGRQWLVRDGKQIKQNTEQISARTAIGLKADGTLVTFVVNGKTNSYGVTINDMSELMFSLGCVNAINLDGGGSSLFATQRAGSSDLVIRNSPSDADGERKVSSVLFLVTEPQSDRLYFDFTNDAAAKERYKADIYGGKNFDTGSWHYHHTYSTAPVFDNKAGTMSFSTTATCPTDRHIHPVITSTNTSYTGGHPLVYIPSGVDYFKVRMKIEGSTDSAASFRMMYANDDGDESTHIGASVAIPSGYTNGEYFTLEGTLNFRQVDAVTAIRPEVYNLTVGDPTKNTVKFTYDYIYIGPKSGAVTADSLLFDFSNSHEARERYATIPYGFMDFDRSTQGFWATAYNSSGSAFSVDNSAGLLHVEVTDGASGSADAGNLTYGPWIKTTNSSGNLTGRTTYAYYPLSYIPENADILQIRFKTENCIVPEGKTPNLVLEYYYTMDDVHAYKNDIRKTYTLTNGSYQTLTIPASSAFKAADVIKCLGFRFQNIKGATVGDIAIDYIYVGPSCTAHNAIHTWDTGAVTTLPTCNSAGVKTYTCTVCKGMKTEPVSATGHTEVLDPAVAPTCTHSGLTEGKHCSVCNTILKVQETVPATGHSYTYTIIDGRNHRVACTNCDLSEVASHSYENGTCICGEAEHKEPVEDVSLKLNHSLNLASDISVNLVISKALLEGFDMDTVYVESTLETYAGNVRTGTQIIRVTPEDKGYFYYFTLDGLTAVQMNDKLSSVLYGTKDGQTYYSPVDEYSIATYAYSQLNKDGVNASLKTLCADLLRYGSKAQIFKSYRTDALADGNMTEAHRAFLSDIEAVTFGNTNVVLNDLPDAPITWAGKALNLESKVALKFVFNMGGYTGELSELSLRISYTDAYGNVKTDTLRNPAPYGQGTGAYVFTVDSLLAAELRAVVSARIYTGETPVSATLQYSPDTYGNNKTGNLLELCKALFAYSDSAKAFFV